MIAFSLAVDAVPLQASDRVVCFGDSITDGYTYGQIIMQALAEAGKPVPPVICAGVASDTAPQMAARVEHTVLNYKPTLVTFSAGTNDALRGVTPEQYETALLEIVNQVTAQGGAVILLTPCLILRPEGKTPEEQEAHAAGIREKLDAFEAVIRKTAATFGCSVAENRQRMAEAVAAGGSIMSADGIHPNYYGQSLMARAILDAAGHADVELPQTFEPKRFPGVIDRWQLRLAPVAADGRAQPLTAEAVAQLQPDATWQTYVLPDPEPAAKPTAEDWLEQIRRNGFALEVEAQLGKGLVQGVADLDGDAGTTVYINTGVGVSTVWFNGQRVHEQGDAWTGFHAGKERIPVTLAAGRNRLVIEIKGSQFFLSVTDRMIWEELLR